MCAIEVTGSPSVLENAVEAGFAQMRRVARRLNPFDPESEIRRLIANARPGRAYPVDEELLGVLDWAWTLAQATDGRYDPTAWPLLELWRACWRSGRWPTEAERRHALARVDYRRVRVDRVARAVTVDDPGVEIDLSSLAKGCALDAALSALRQPGIESARLTAGGQVATWRADGRPIAIHIADPWDRGIVRQSIELAQGAASTSNQSESPLMIDAYPIGHLFDTRTGWPVESGVESVTVTAPTGLAADGLSTAMFVAGPSDGASLLEHVPGAEAWIWRRDGGPAVGERQVKRAQALVEARS